MNTAYTKQELRLIYKQKRMTLSQDEVIFLSNKIFKNLILQFNIIENQIINIFLPIKKFNEVDTELFLDYLFENKNRVFVPRIDGEKIESVEIFPDTNYEINSWGIKEPIAQYPPVSIDFDIVFVPLLYCDAYGNRIGYGKGFYDRFFSSGLKINKKIGLNFYNPQYTILNISPLDVKIDALITPEKYIEFK